MDRLVDNAFAVSIRAALNAYPSELHRHLGCDYFTGTDPVFAGLTLDTDTGDGRSYRTTAHVTAPMHQSHLVKSQRRTTVVLPLIDEDTEPWVIVHELAHVLHFNLGLPAEMDARPVTAYAQRNRFEAFAEAVTAWLIPGYAETRDTSLEARLSAVAS